MLAYSTVTNTGNASVTGDVGLTPGTAITGFAGISGGPGQITDGSFTAGPAYTQVRNDATAAYLDLQGRSGATDKTGVDLGNEVWTPGVYKFSSSVGLTGTMVLDGPGEYIFQVGSTLTTASYSDMQFINGATASDVFWQIGSSATLGTYTDFAGTIIALASITATTGSTVHGRLVALNGAVTLDTNIVSVPPLR